MHLRPPLAQISALLLQAQAAAESASQEKALRAPMEAEVARLRRHCKAIESRSRALERELLELQARAGDIKGAARLLSEPVSFSGRYRFRANLPWLYYVLITLLKFLDAPVESKNALCQGKRRQGAARLLSEPVSASDDPRTGGKVGDRCGGFLMTVESNIALSWGRQHQGRCEAAH